MTDTYWFICVREAYPAAVPIVASSQPNFNRAVVNAIAGVRKSRHGIGDLLLRPVPGAIDDHLLCDGSAVGRKDYPQLFELLGETWGAGDGVTTFNIPDLVSAPITAPAVVPTQVVQDTSSTTGGTPTAPAGSGETGGVRGGRPSTGGRPGKEALP